ncbi:MAG: hypothetical protein GWO24_25435, partial [Akkermansiaceae bacterium]|nr:hypothetical protein [Akkermansiaceae bacterium]
SRARLDNVRRLRKRGLLEDAPRKRGDLLRLTELGHHALAGGRHPDGAWNRDWDGKWRLLVFDLPQKAGRGRVQFWRWLRKNHFGRIQGSVWITPDPV